MPDINLQQVLLYINVTGLGAKRYRHDARRTRIMTLPRCLSIPIANFEFQALSAPKFHQILSGTRVKAIAQSCAFTKPMDLQPSLGSYGSQMCILFRKDSSCYAGTSVDKIEHAFWTNPEEPGQLKCACTLSSTLIGQSVI